MYLNCHSYYSLRYGALSLSDLIDGALRNDMDTIALTDINNTTALPEFVFLAQSKGLKPVGGADIRKGNRRIAVCIARNNPGLREINSFLSDIAINGRKHDAIPDFDNAYVIFPAGCVPDRPLKDNEYVGVALWQTHLLPLLVAKYRITKMLVLHSLSVGSDESYELHRHLRAIDKNTLLSKLMPADLARRGDRFVNPSTIRAAFAAYPEVVSNTLNLLRNCSLHFDSSVKNLKMFTGNARDDRNLLAREAYAGLVLRYGTDNAEAMRRLEHELGIIENMGFASYFLIAWDLVRYTMSRGFYHVGRGSGANSIAAYCLRITDVDPIELDLYFERFLNPKRSSPPDFDIDYSWSDRDEVHNYLFDKYGKERCALLGAMSTFRSRAALRELGKVYGLTGDELENLSHRPAQYGRSDDVHRRIVKIAAQMDGFPNLRTIHAGGVLISNEPITTFAALDMPPKGYQTTQWDMYTAEHIGFEKFDILSQRGIGHIRESCEIILKNKGVEVDIHDIPRFKQDEASRQLLKSAHTTGCFYIESPAMKGLLRKLRCEDYITLVAASSIIRPGVSSSGMMQEYIRRFHNQDGFEYLHPVMKEQLEETYGVMVYQEDVLKVCHHYAGLDLADADVLRRAMSGKFRSRAEFERIFDRFFEGCRSKGRPEEISREVWRQIASFAGYSFSKAHSASYAAESFQSLYLKAHYPLEFMTAVINNFGGYYFSWVYFQEARRLGANICLPCVNRSNYMTCIRGSDIYVGFIHLQNLEQQLAHRIVAERERGGDYTGLGDFVKRIAAGREQLTILIRSGAFSFTGKTKAELLWLAHDMTQKVKTPPPMPVAMFEPELRDWRLPAFNSDRLEDAYDEIELIGFPVGMSWFDLLQTSFRGEVMAGDMLNHTGQTVRMLGLFVTLKYVYTSKKEIMNFGAWLDAEGNFFDSVHFPASLKEYPFRGNGLYLMLGKVSEEFGHPTLDVQKLARLPLKPDPREK